MMFSKLKNESPALTIVVCVIVLGLIFGLFCAEAAIAMLLWNGCLVPAMGLLIREVGFWQMMGIMVLSNILFGSVRAISKLASSGK